MEMTESRKRVLIVGAGAAGTAAAYSLSKCPDKFDVELWEKGRVPGGVACTSAIKGGLHINDGMSVALLLIFIIAATELAYVPGYCQHRYYEKQTLFNVNIVLCIRENTVHSLQLQYEQLLIFTQAKLVLSIFLYFSMLCALYIQRKITLRY